MSTKQRVLEGTAKVCCHRVSYFYRLPKHKRVSTELKARMYDEAEARAKECIIDDCNQGELNYETDNFQATGWWKINN